MEEQKEATGIVQSSNFSDLESALERASAYEERIRLLLALSDALGSEDLNRALGYAEQALAESGAASDELGIARSHLRIGRRRNYRGEHRSALAEIEMALPVVSAIGTFEDIADACLTAGMAHFYLGQFGTTQQYATQGLELCERHNATGRCGDFYNMVAAVETKMGNHRRALEYYQRAITIAEEAGDRRQTALRQANIANTYKTLGEFITALEYYQRSYNTAVELDDRRLFIMAGMGLGRIYVDMEDYHRALEYFLRVIATCNEIGFRIYLLACHLNLAVIYFHLDNYTEAVQQCLLALGLAREQGDKQAEAHALQDLGVFYFLTGELDNALEYLMQALALREEMGYTHAVAESMLAVGRVYLRLEQPAEALSYLHKSLAYYQTIEPEQIEQSKGHDSLAILYLALAEATSLTEDHENSSRYMERFSELKQAADATRRGSRARNSVQAFEMELALKLAQKYGIQLPLSDKASEVLFTVERAQTANEKSEPSIRVSTFGRFEITIGDRVLTAVDWKRKKARDLFKILLTHHRRAVTADELIDLLWEGTGPDNAQNVLWNAVSTTRLLLEPNLGRKMPSSFLRTADRSYTLDFGDGACIDFIAFRTWMAEARKENDAQRRVELLTKAVELYTGDFLPDDQAEEWASFERESLREAWLSALLQLAHHAAEHCDLEKAAAYAETILAADRLHTEAWQLLLDLYRTAGRDAEAQGTAERCRRAFAEEAGSMPPESLT